MAVRAAGGSDGPLIYLIAGEPSGDLLGARLMSALKNETAGRVRFAGVGGPLMEAEGLQSLFPMSEISIMGLMEVLPHLRRVLGLIDRTVDDVLARAPAALVTIDSPGFSLRVSRRVKTRVGAGDPRLIHYVAPSVWAWKPGRARKVARYLDHLIALLPFEPPYFEAHGLATTVAGHPAVEDADRKTDGPGLRARLGIARDAPLLCVLPGSRAGEVAKHSAIFAETLRRLGESHEGLRALVPTVPGVRARVEEAVAGWPVPAHVIDPADKFDAFAAADAALAASGTVAVELAVAGVPTVVAYKVSYVSALLAAALLKIKFVSLINLVLDREVQPEFLQHRCIPRLLAPALAELLDDPAARARQVEGAKAAVVRLGLGDERPSTRAARTVLAAIGAGPEVQNTYTEPRSNRAGGPPESGSNKQRKSR